MKGAVLRYTSFSHLLHDVSEGFQQNGEIVAYRSSSIAFSSSPRPVSLLPHSCFLESPS